MTFVILRSLTTIFVILLMQSAFCDVSTPHVCKDNGKCFTVIVNPQLSWEKAEEYCGKNLSNGQLASLHNAFDNSIVAGWLPFLSSNPWIGSIRFGSLPFSWTDGSDFNQYNNWASGQPSSGNCVQVCRSTTSAGTNCVQGKWSTMDCSTEAQFICEYGNVNEATSIPLTTTPPKVPSCPAQWTYFPTTQFCYRTFFNAISWDDAEGTCTSNGAHLASIHSVAENDFVGDLASTHTELSSDIMQTWIGMHDLKHNRQWSWSDGSSVNYFHWAPGSPDNSGGTEFCVELFSDSHLDDPNVKYHWNDDTCEKQMRAFVCKRAPIWRES